MKKQLRAFLLVVFIIPLCFLFSGCSTSDMRSIANIEKSYSVGLVDYYKINYTDGTSDTFSITNGQDGRDGKDGVNGDTLTIESIYSIIESEFNGDIYDFIEAYLTINTKADSDNFAYGSSKALLSTVSIYCEFPEITKVPMYYSNGWFAGYKNQKTTACFSGSGVILDLDENGNAYVVTNYHVVFDADSTTSNKMPKKVVVYIYGQESFGGYLYDSNNNEVKDSEGYQTLDYGQYAIEAQVVGGSSENDIAVLKIENSEILKNSDCHSAKVLSSTQNTIVGKTVMAVGNAEGLGISCTRGIVSVDSENIAISGIVDESTKQVFRVIRTDCAINSGNSGGGLYDVNGDLLGIVNAKIIETGTDNIGYAIPADVAIRVAQNIIYNYENKSSGKISKAVIGIKQQISDSYSEYDSTTLTVKIHNIIKVVEVVENTPASGVDIQVGDIIKRVKLSNTINGETDEIMETIERSYQVSDLLFLAKENTTLTLYLQRENVVDLVEVTITLTNDNFKIIE